MESDWLGGRMIMALGQSACLIDHSDSETGNANLYTTHERKSHLESPHGKALYAARGK
jgi:hypothetical protein